MGGGRGKSPPPQAGRAGGPGKPRQHGPPLPPVPPHARAAAPACGFVPGYRVLYHWSTYSALTAKLPGGTFSALLWTTMFSGHHR